MNIFRLLNFLFLHLALTVDQFDALWEVLFADVEGGRQRFLRWILDQLRDRDAHALSEILIKHIVEQKVTILLLCC